MSNNDLTIRTHHLAIRSVLAGVIVVGLPVAMAACGSDADSPAVPTSLAPPTGTAPVTTIGAGVPLEPGSNLPPGETENDGDTETITTTTD